MRPKNSLERRVSARRLFAIYAVVSLIPVLVLGAVLLGVLQRNADARGIAEGKARADLIVRTAIAPLLTGSDLSGGLSGGEQAGVEREVQLAMQSGDVLRLRIRNLSGQLIFSHQEVHDGDVEAVGRAVAGQTVARLTWLNADGAGPGSRGPRALEIFQPLNSVQDGRRIGVVVLYLPYGPIASEISAGQRTVTFTLAGGVLLVWLCTLAVSASVTGRLRRQILINGHLADHDALTALPNRAQFNRRARVALAAGPAAIAVIDLDRFKDVNDALGHGNGDLLLSMLAQRLRSMLRPGDTIARLGGDEFGVVLAGLGEECVAIERIAGIRRRLGDPITVNGVPLVVEASVGLALAPHDGTDIDTLLARADLAMYVAKRQHLGVLRYRVEQDGHNAATLSLVGELGGAIERGELVLHYQPKGDLRDGVVTELEALVRWRHPRHGLLFPDAFLPLAEQTELIEDLTRWVIGMVAAELPRLDPAGRLAVAVNVSAHSVVRAEFAADVLAVLQQCRLDPRRLVVEVTETALLTDPAAAARTLTELNAAGVRIAIDDFGAGQTSLGYLATLPVSELKIDKTFVLPMTTDTRKAAIVQSVIELGHSLGFTVTAEGVETAEALDRLTDAGCDTAQGYLLARPAAPADLPAGIQQATAALQGRSRPAAPSPAPAPGLWAAQP
ncbi:MAG TPA: bifunctional diguanylate cyclase/phosphodiesterase [Jatrophihabitans sp.]|nr:bifunctional diguanylate cyclase/phosphodiesterase [Jatrophihabitans sp.]